MIEHPSPSGCPRACFTVSPPGPETVKQAKRRLKQERNRTGASAPEKPFLAGTSGLSSPETGRGTGPNRPFHPAFQSDPRVKQLRGAVLGGSGTLSGDGRLPGLGGGRDRVQVVALAKISSPDAISEDGRSRAPGGALSHSKTAASAVSDSRM